MEVREAKIRSQVLRVLNMTLDRGRARAGRAVPDGDYFVEESHVRRNNDTLHINMKGRDPGYDIQPLIGSPFAKIAQKSKCHTLQPLESSVEKTTAGLAPNVHQVEKSRSDDGSIYPQHHSRVGPKGIPKEGVCEKKELFCTSQLCLHVIVKGELGVDN